MGLFRGFVMALGMFSIIPVPKNSWNDKYTPVVIPSLPLAGALLGLIWFGLSYALSALSAPPMILSASILFIPFILTGFIHADGYIDAADAVFSRRDLDEKKRILKDPHLGAFAVIAVIGLFILQFSAVYTIVGAQKPLLTFVFILVISRCVAGVAMLNLKPVFETGYNAAFRAGTKPRHTLFICLLAFVGLTAAWFISGAAALFPLLAGALAGVAAVVYLYRQFHGISGDLSGCVITIGEFAALLCMALL